MSPRSSVWVCSTKEDVAEPKLEIIFSLSSQSLTRRSAWMCTHSATCINIVAGMCVLCARSIYCSVQQLLLCSFLRIFVYFFIPNVLNLQQYQLFLSNNNSILPIEYNSRPEIECMQYFPYFILYISSSRHSRSTSILYSGIVPQFW